MICLQIVYQLYWVVFARDLKQTEYFERDFVVVVACLLAIQVYFAIRRLILEKENALKERDEWEEAHNENIELRSKQAELQEREYLWRSYLNVLAKPIKASKDGVELEIYASEIEKLYRTDIDIKLKNITAELIDGREVMLNYPSLNAFEEAFEHLTFRISRNLLLCHLVIAEQYEEGGQYYVRIRGDKGKRIPMSQERYHALKEIRAWYFEFTKYQKD